MFRSSWSAGILALVIFSVWLGLVFFLTKLGIISGNSSRKVVHIGTGPIFIVCWLFFPDVQLSRYIAASLPLMISLMLVVTATGVFHHRALVNIMTRYGNPKELLAGPLFYGLVFVVITILFWKSASAIITLAILCAGDGLADVFGTKFGTTTLPWSRKKTVTGSIAMFVFGLTLSIILITIYRIANQLEGPITFYIFPVIVVSAISTVIESVSTSNIDNLTVPTAAILSSLLFFPVG
jgi:phytol kinase